MITNTKNTDVTMLKLGDLFLSEHNVRTVATSKESNKILKASIKAQGLKQNLVVISAGKKYGVVAGGRRLAQLNELLEEGEIKSTYLVPCMIDTAENISAISLSENIKASMHPADEFVAFQSMMDEGKTVVQIANEFGIAQGLVKKRLKMAGVSSELLDFYRQGKIDLEHIMAFTVTDDHARQMACYKELSTHYMSANKVRNFLLDTALLTTHGMVKLVTLKSFKKAGGTTTTDLFESATYINERDLIESLALEILNKKAKTLAKQWKWVDVTLSANSYSDYETQLRAEFVGLPKKLIKDLQKKEKALDVLNDKNGVDWTDADDDLETELEGAIEALEGKREKYRHFSDEQKAVSGVMVSFDSTGAIIVELGFVKKEDMALAFPPVATKAGEVPTDDLSSSKGVESNALNTDLQHFKLQALQSEIMKNDKLTYDLMVYSLVKRLLSENFYCDLTLDIAINKTDLKATDGIEDTEPHQAINSFKTSLELSWLAIETEEAKFLAFRALSSVQKKQLLSYCTAMSYRSESSSSIESVITETINFDISKYWKPTKDNYFKRIKTRDLLAIGARQISEQWAVDNAKLSKGQIVDSLDGHDDLAEWMPESMTQ